MDVTSGWGRYSRNLVSSLIQEGHTVRCIVHTVSDDVSVEQHAFLSDPLAYLANPILSWKAAKFVRKFLKEHSIDVVYIAVEPYATILPFLGKNSFVSVMTVHGTYSYIPHLFSNPFKRLISYILTLVLYRIVDRVVSVSAYTKQYLLSHMINFGGENFADKIIVIPNGVIMSVTDRSFQRESDTFLTVGAVKERKGLIEALNVVALYRQKYNKNVRFHIVGAYNEGNPHYQKALKRITDLGLEQCVVWEGRLNDGELSERYEKATAFILLSGSDGKFFEGFGLVYLEANARGVPVIGNYGSGAEEAISQGRSGFLVRAGDKEEAVKALHTIVESRSLFDETTREWAELHDWRKIVKRYTTLFSDIRK